METTAGFKHSVLVVDDEELIASLFEQILTQEGYNVHTALNGEQAVRSFAEHQEEWSCIIIDMTMPDMVGTEVYRKLCTLRDGVPVIFVSGYSAEMTALKNSCETAVKFLQKPFTPNELAKEVAKILK